MSTHPRTRKRIEEASLQVPSAIETLKPLGFLDYLQLQLNSAAVLSDSGTITEEANLLNFPALNLRETHERPEGMEEGAVIMTGLNPTRIQQALSLVLKQPRNERATSLVKDYDLTNVSDKVLRILLSYTDYVKRTVWHSNS